MNFAGRNSFFKAVLLVCVLMQAVALMPHHHHAGSDTVCLNYFHLNSGVCGELCKDKHTHADQPYSTCTSYSIVVAQPEFRDNDTEEVAVDLPDCGCGLCVAEFDSGIFNVPVVVLDNYDTGANTPEAILRVYLTAARPCRAPDFMG